MIKHQWKTADNFAGGGGASLGIEQAMGRYVDVAVNHDRYAVAMHRVNHPHTKHYLEDIWKIDPLEAMGGQRCRLAWFSPDCSHFSKARGGKPVSNNIRGLAWVILRWAAKARPDVIMLENVEEFRTWGPLTRRRGRQRHPQPCRLRSGATFARWQQQLKDLGYKLDYRELVACDYGAPTIRKRFFMIAKRDGQPIVWPAKTHSTAADNLPAYRTAAECIDWRVTCPSIFERRKPLVENTMRRIFNGVRKFILNEPHPFVLHGDTQVRGDHSGLVAAYIIKHFGGATGTAVTNPFPTITTKGCQNQLVTGRLLKVTDTHAVAADSRVATVRAFLLKFYGTCNDGQRLDIPGHTVTTKSRLGLVTVYGEPYQIVDIGMRMLTPAELFEVQGFQVRGFRGNVDGYIIAPEIDGKPMTKTMQIAKCGNAVCPPVVKALVTANVV